MKSAWEKAPLLKSPCPDAWNQGETRFRLYEKRQWKFCGGVIQICGTTLFCFSMNNPEIGQVWTCHLYQENHIKRRFRNFLSETILGPLEAKLLTHLTAVLLNNNPTGGKEEETMFLQIKLNLITLKISSEVFTINSWNMTRSRYILNN